MGSLRQKKNPENPAKFIFGSIESTYDYFALISGAGKLYSTTVREDIENYRSQGIRGIDLSIDLR